MKSMRKLILLAAAVLSIAVTASAQDYPSEPYEFILAKLASAEGRFDEALGHLDKVLEKEPDNSVLLYERAMILVDASRIDKAEAELRKVVTIKPEFYDAQRILGRILLDRAGSDRTKVDEALDHLKAAFKANPDDLGTGIAVSQIYVSTGRTAEAEKVLAQLIERAPDQRALNYNYAQVLTKLGRGNESKQYLERAVLLDPTFGPAILQLVDLYQKEGEWEKAATVLQPLIEEDPMNLDLQRQQAYYFLRAGQTDKARARFKALAQADPHDTRSRFYLAESLADMQQYEEADKIYRALLEQTPDDADLMASYGISQMSQKKYDDAAKTFHTLLGFKDLPDNSVVLAKTQLAAIDLARGNYDQAVAGTKDILVFRDKPNNQAVAVALDALKKEKKYKEGVALLQPLVDKYASDALLSSRYIEMLARAGDMQQAQLAASTQMKFGVRNTLAAAEAYIAADQTPAAITLLKDALKTKADNVDLQFELGSAFERAGDRGNAEKTFLGILEKNPEHAGTMNYLGYMWAESGQNLDRAAAMLTKAVGQEPRNGAYIDSLGWVYYRQGKLDLAEKLLTDATRLLPNDATVHEHLGDVVAKRGDVTRALSLYRVALVLEQESKDEQKLRTKIAELEKQAQAAKR
jgi:tetratricopeptide (TPR) repeat protein